ncbi:MAG: hypothetical protein EOO60_13810 [Hymenobacter sp.]|nr:MAG: hypothetical protein EOO60_13810 [Hymenobacter sp.]
MKYILTFVLLLAGAFSTYCCAQARVSHAAAKGPVGRPETLTNKGVIALTGAGLSPELIVAKIDGSGYHHFSTTFEEHKKYASQYHQTQDERGNR